MFVSGRCFSLSHWLYCAGPESISVAPQWYDNYSSLQRSSNHSNKIFPWVSCMIYLPFILYLMLSFLANFVLKQASFISLYDETSMALASLAFYGIMIWTSWCFILFRVAVCSTKSAKHHAYQTQNFYTSWHNIFRTTCPPSYTNVFLYRPFSDDQYVSSNL